MSYFFDLDLAITSATVPIIPTITIPAPKIFFVQLPHFEAYVWGEV